MSVPYETHSSWSWPEEELTPAHDMKTHLPGSFEEGEPIPAPDANGPTKDAKPERSYPPRMCRICLETILPTFEPTTESFGTMLDPIPKVSYISSDPNAGRLIRPCKCSGSSRYVHEGCLQAWRHADPAYQRKNYWECPTCKFRYRLERMKWARWISSSSLQILLTIAIMLTAVFLFGFIADPIINLYLDPYDTITSLPSGGPPALHFEEDKATWAEHFLKGVASIGMLGFVKVFITSPWHWYNLRQTRILGTGGRRGGTGRDRLENISWSLVFIGVITFLLAVWKWVRAWSRRTLESAGERVADVQGEDDDFEEQPAAKNDTATATPSSPQTESRKTQ